MSTFAGTGPLVRLILRRDRWMLGLWVLSLALYAWYGVSFTEDANPTAADRLSYVDTIAGNSGFLMFYGPAYGSSVGALATWRVGDILWITALASLLTVIRHTRADEETGRRELLGATVIGRQANLAAALTVTMAANLVLAAFTALLLISSGLTAAGSIALGLKFAAVGWSFAAIAALAAQLTASAAAARGMAVAALGASFLLRAAADAGGVDGGTSWLSWLSPLGWAHRLRPFADEQWSVLALPVGVVVAATAAALAISARRDVAAGVLPPRLGPAEAAPSLRSPLSLAWRLHRGQLLGWVAGLAVFGIVFGTSANSAASVFEDSQQVEDIFERLGGTASAGDVWLAGIMSFLGLFAAAYAVQAMLRLRAEEEALRAEPVLATAVGRLRWSASHLAFSLLGPALAMTAAGLAAGLGYGLSTGDVGHEVPRVLGGALVQLPAVWVLTGLTIALCGLLPRLTLAAWGAWGIVVFLGQLGAMLNLRQRLLDLSPFTHVPKLPGGQWAATPLVWLTVLTAVLVLAGLAGLRRRDIGRT